MRKLLILTSRSLPEDVVDRLQAGDWEILYAKNALEARRLIQQEEFLVGLLVLWPEDTDKHKDESRETVSAFSQIRWAGALLRKLMELDSFVALAAEHLYDYLFLPLDAERLLVILGHAYGMALTDRLFMQQQGLTSNGRFGMVGDSPTAQALYRSIERAANCDIPVMIHGETGAGKGTIARAIHKHSASASRPFVAINCAVDPIPLMQTMPVGEGSTKRADIAANERDYFQAGASGTIFLDNVGELSKRAQTSLLRLLKNNHSGWRGKADPEGIHLRVISGTCEDLQKLVQEGRFRLDLYLALQVLLIRTPSLRARGEDLHALAQHFLEEFRQDNRSTAISFSRAALVVMHRYEWPGNLRELQNCIYQAAVCARSRYITPADLQLEGRSGNRSQQSLQEAREISEKHAVESALRRNQHNLSKAASDLQVSRVTLYRLLEKHGLHSRD